MTTIAHARRASIARQIEQTGVVAVIRLRDPGKVRGVADALMAGGVRVLEVTMTMPGPQFVRDVRAPLPQVKLMPTGGVTLENAGDWIRAGAVAIGIGSALVDARAVERGEFDVIAANARQVIANVHAARSG